MPDGTTVINDLKNLANIATGGDLSKVGVGTTFGGGGDDPLIYWVESIKPLTESMVKEVTDKIELMIPPRAPFSEKIGKTYHSTFYIKGYAV